MNSSRQGVAFAVAAYTIWGVVPVYFKWLANVAAAELLFHRIVWSVVLLAIFILATRRGAKLRAVLRDRRALGWLAVSSVLVSTNWVVYIWAVQHERIVETSLGYFINPLFSVLLGIVFLHERIGRVQVLAVAIAAVGVLNEIVHVGVFPWVALTLAFTFGLYGFVRKRVAVDSIVGLGVETVWLAPFALAGIGVMAGEGTLAFGNVSIATDLALAAAGVITAVPLVCFAAAALRLPLTMLGIFQYVAPSLALLIAVEVYGEPFTLRNAVTFGCIWTGLALFTASALHGERKRRKAGIVAAARAG